VLADFGDVRKPNVVDLDLLDLLIDERNYAREGHSVTAMRACPLSANALKELVSDDNNRIILKLGHREARLSFDDRVVGVVLRCPNGYLVRQENFQFLVSVCRGLHMLDDKRAAQRVFVFQTFAHHSQHERLGARALAAARSGSDHLHLGNGFVRERNGVGIVAVKVLIDRILRVILRHPIARVSLKLLNATEIAKYRDHRLTLVKGDTVRRFSKSDNVWERSVRLSTGSPPRSSSASAWRAHSSASALWRKVRDNCCPWRRT
jgi:hypothetical protein